MRTQSPTLLMAMGGLWLLLAAALLVFQLLGPVRINVEWTTATELNTAGFNLYRSQSPDGDFLQVNDRLIPSQGTTTSGSAYTYVDEAVEAGNTYYYMLEEVELDASINRYEADVFAYEVPRVTIWALVSTAVSVVIGLFLLAAGIREQRG